MNASTSSRRNSLPRVAIVGRPNVGKSTLFNRIAGGRRSITDAAPGVTRDTVEAACTINNRDIILIDTGGYSSDGEDIAALVSQRSLRTIEDADVVLLLVDVTQLTPEDEEFIGRLRRFADKIVLVVNKTDSALRDNAVWEYYSLGFRQVIPISAEHGRNIDLLLHSLFELLPPETVEAEEGQYASREEICITILGKPNTGKSTLLNTLLGFDRAIVSDTPGTTRDVLEGSFVYSGNNFTILDTAGIRKKRSVEEAVEYYSVSRAISSIDRADVVFLMIDSQEGVTDQDKKIADQIVKRGRGVIVVLSKWDVMSKIPNALNAVSDRTRFLFPQLDFAPIVPVSAHENTGLDKLLSTTVRVRRQLGRQLAAHELNQTLRILIERHPPPYGKKRYRVKYLAQVSFHPLKFALFVNKVKGFPASWVSYLENSLRREYKMDLVPISIDLRGR
ncbi:MAG: ribosome biogenesis GTPase Der [Spirochaetales bacterium]|nr:ribosome biogenesis GTPase Der [Spirochaetales bacterium]